MKKCLYCHCSDYCKDSIISLCLYHLARQCTTCFCMNNCEKNSYIGCNNSCYKLTNIRYSNRFYAAWYSRCSLCYFLNNIYHHCTIPIKNKYMNINVL